MLMLGLTGSIGMGKSTTASLFEEAGIAVFDADACVYALYKAGQPGNLLLRQKFGDILDPNGAIDRKKLGDLITKEPTKLTEIEALIHPLVAKERESFIAKAKQSGSPAILFDIPLLFEKNLYRQFDYIIVVDAPEPIQRQRVLSRPGMTVEKFESILASQFSNAEKCQRADFVIDTSISVADARRQVEIILSALSLTTDKERK